MANRSGVNMVTVLALILALSTAGRAAVYYVNSNTAIGNDGHNGTSEQTAWATLGKINSIAVAADDSILFARNGVWHGSLLVTRSGSAGHPIYYGAYGSGNRPLIHGDGTAEATVRISNNASHLVIDGLALTNFDGVDLVDGVEGDRCGIKVVWGGQQSDIKILRNEIYYIEGCSNHPSVGSPRGTTLDVANFHQYNNGAVFSWVTTDSFTIDSNYIHDCTCAGIQVMTGIKTLVQNNTVQNVGADGIVVRQAVAPLIQYNRCIGAGNSSPNTTRGVGVLGANGLAVAGIWVVGTSNALIQYNYCEGTRRIVWDGTPWDFDIGTTGGVYQYNFSRDNEGGLNLGGNDSVAAKQVYRYNISYNDCLNPAAGQGFLFGSAQFYNNVFYMDNGKSFSFVGNCNCKNNVFYSNSATPISYLGDQRVFATNCYYGHIAQNTGTDPVTQDPLFVSTQSIGHSIVDVAGFKLQTGSPCINKGTAIANNGGKDYWGVPLTDGAPDIGACEAGVAGGDSITSFSPPASLTAGSTYSINVGYFVPANRILSVQFFDSVWHVVTQNHVTINAGSGSATLDLTIPAATPPGSHYNWQASLYSTDWASGVGSPKHLYNVAVNGTTPIGPRDFMPRRAAHANTISFRTGAQGAIVAGIYLARTSRVAFRVYSAEGQLVRKLDLVEPAGVYSIQIAGRGFLGLPLSKGVYIVKAKIIDGGQSATMQNSLSRNGDAMFAKVVPK